MKTGTQLSIKVPNKSLEIINKYKPEIVNPNAFVFPMFPADIDLDNARELDTEISRATAYINKNLKTIATKLELNKKVSFHVSRHTFATRALRKGISIDKVSKIMGHAAIRETQIYAKIVSSELDKAMDVFND
jgi:integrase